ncbi:MAG: DnaA/Hda family protein [Alphaproteobacteria bacterium]|nr:DnaA/Hda family protein [Alphaproteobacteria bacterium]
MPEQLPFDLETVSRYTRGDFFEAPCNAAALQQVAQYPPSWPSHVLIVCGPPGAGKTHLAAIWQQESSAVVVQGALPAPEEGLRAVVVDDAPRFTVDEAQARSFLHLYNHLKETGGHMLLTAETPPRDWGIALPDLKSRLLSVPVVTVSPPDDAVLSVVLAKMFSDRQLAVPADVIAFLVKRMERSFAAARSLVARIDTKALAEKRAVTVPFVRDLLDAG